MHNYTNNNAVRSGAHAARQSRGHCKPGSLINAASLCQQICIHSNILEHVRASHVRYDANFKNIKILLLHSAGIDPEILSWSFEIEALGQSSKFQSYSELESFRIWWYLSLTHRWQMKVPSRARVPTEEVRSFDGSFKRGVCRQGHLHPGGG